MDQTSITAAGAIDTFLVLLIGIGPKLALVPFLEITAALDRTAKQRVLRKMLVTAASVAVILMVLGELLRKLLHFTIGSLSIAGGVILLVLAVWMVLGPPASSQHTANKDPMQLAQYPLAVPYLLNPVGIVGLMTISADAESWSVFAVEFGILVFVLLLDVVVFRLANRVSEKLDENRMLVTEKVFGFLIAAIAVQLVLDGLALEGIIAHVPHLTRGSDISPASDDMQAVPLTLASGQVSPGHMRWPGEPTGGRQTLPMSRRTVVANSVMTDWIDVSVTVRHGMPHWPDNPPIVLERVLDTGRGDACNVSHLAMGVHSGTHMDGPVHFIHGAGGLDEMPLTATMGEARVIEIEHPREITADELRKHGLQPGERVLFRTSNSVLCWQSGSFVEDFVSISEQAAMLLAETKVRTVGIDYLSVGGYLSDGAKIHKILLEAGIWIIEGLDLSPVVGGRYEMICLPVKLHGSDGAPARAILRPIGSSGLGRAVSVQAVS